MKRECDLIAHTRGVREVVKSDRYSIHISRNPDIPKRAVRVCGTTRVVAHEDSLDTFYSSLDRNRIPEGDDKALTGIRRKQVT